MLGGVGILTAGVVGASTRRARRARTTTSRRPAPTSRPRTRSADKSSRRRHRHRHPRRHDARQQLTLPRSASLNLLFDNDDSVPRQLVVEAGEQPKLEPDGQQVKDANGNVIMVPVKFHTDYIGEGKAAVLTVTMPHARACSRSGRRPGTTSGCSKERSSCRDGRAEEAPGLRWRRWRKREPRTAPVAGALAALGAAGPSPASVWRWPAAPRTPRSTRSSPKGARGPEDPEPAGPGLHHRRRRRRPRPAS